MKTPTTTSLTGKAPKGGSDVGGQAAALVARVGQEFAFRQNPTGFVANQQKIISATSRQRRELLDQFAIAGKKPSAEVLAELDNLSIAAKKRATVESIHPSVRASLIQRGEFDPVALLQDEEGIRDRLHELTRDVRTEVGNRTDSISLKNAKNTEAFNAIRLEEARIEQADDASFRAFDTQFGGLNSAQLEQVGANGLYAQFGNASQFRRYKQNARAGEIKSIKDELSLTTAQNDLIASRERSKQAERELAISELSNEMLEAGIEKIEATGSDTVAGIKFTSSQELKEALLANNENDIKFREYRANKQINIAENLSFSEDIERTEGFVNGLGIAMPSVLDSRIQKLEFNEKNERARMEAEGASELDILKSLNSTFGEDKQVIRGQLEDMTTALIAEQPKEVRNALTTLSKNGTMSPAQGRAVLINNGVSPLSTTSPIHRPSAQVLAGILSSPTIQGATGATEAPEATGDAQLTALQIALGQTSKKSTTKKTPTVKAITTARRREIIDNLPADDVLKIGQVMEGAIQEHAMHNALLSVAGDAGDGSVINRLLGALTRNSDPEVTPFLNSFIAPRGTEESEGGLSTLRLNQALDQIEQEAIRAGELPEGTPPGTLLTSIISKLSDKEFSSQLAKSTVSLNPQDVALENIAFPNANQLLASPENVRLAQISILANGLENSLEQANQEAISRAATDAERRAIVTRIARRRAFAINPQIRGIVDFLDNRDENTINDIAATGGNVLPLIDPTYQGR